jgi:hypothetical protein
MENPPYFSCHKIERGGKKKRKRKEEMRKI